MKIKKGKLASFFGFKSQNQEESTEQKSLPVTDKPIDFGEDIHTEQPAVIDSAIADSKATEPVAINSENLLEPSTEIEEKTVEVEEKATVADPLEVEATNTEFKMATPEPTMDYEHEEEHLIVNYSKEQLAVSEEKLEEFMRVCPGAYGVLISTVDGHELLYLVKRDIPVHKISTMNSSLLALGESIARESSQKLCQFVILENSDGRVVSLRINDILMLTCISSKDTNLGMLLSVGRNTAGDLMKILS